MSSLPIIGASLGAAALGAAVGGGLAYLGRRVVMPRPPKHVEISLNEAGTHVALPLSPTTTAPGEHGLWFDGGHARIGQITEIDEAAGTVLREIKQLTGHRLDEATQGRWSGHTFGLAEHVHANVQEVRIRTPEDDAPAWLFPTADGGGETWAIHIHGIRTSRYSALRSVPIALKLGLTSLVPSYYGDVDNAGDGRRPSYLGQREWIDVEAGLDFAVEQGATRIVLFGWSMGATISLLLAERSRHSSLIAGMILVSPATNMRSTIEAAARDAGLPGVVARAVPFALGTWPLSKMSGLGESIDFDALSWDRPGRLGVQTLAVHSEGDTDISAVMTRRFVEANPEYATLALLDPVPHQLEWNASPERFEQTIASWVEQKGILTTP